MFIGNKSIDKIIFNNAEITKYWHNSVLFELYKPYINYSWSQTLTVGDNQLIKDTGTAGLNLQQFFGQGVWFNGIDMQVTIPVNATIKTEIRRVNGVVEINTNTQNLTNYNVYSGSGAKVYKDLYMFNRILTQVEIEKYNNQPNEFFMDSLEDSSCILAMPMCEKDGYVRNYKSYTVDSNNLVGNYFNTDYNSPTTPTVGTTTIYSGVITQTVTTIGSSTSYPRIDFGSTSTRLAGKAYLYEFEYEVLSGVCVLSGFYNGVIFGAQTLQGKGKVSVVSMGTTDRTTNNIYLNGMNLFSVKIWNFSVKEVTSGIHKLTNYTTPSITNAQRLPYGLQTSGFKRNALGMILSKSNYLEFDGISYGSTEWIPKVNEDFTVEAIFEVSNDSELRLNGNSFNNGIYFGKNSGGKNLYVRVFGSTVSQLANTKDFVCLSFSYNAQTKEVKQYLDGVLVRTELAINTTNVTLPLLLGLVTSISSTNYSVVKPIRLLKVHQKALTQEEVTKNFNTYQSQGLLNE